MSVRIGGSAYPLSQVAIPAVLVIFGLFGLLMMGFAQGTLPHEFVHDARHRLAFPCH